METRGTRSVAFRRGKSVIARILPGTDLITGIVDVCRMHDPDTGFALFQFTPPHGEP